MTTQDIIKMLPIDEAKKVKILSQYDSMSETERLSIDEMAWNSYFELYEERLKENVNMQYERVKKGEEPYGDFYPRALAKTDQEMTAESKEEATTIDLSAARKEMEQLVQNSQSAQTDDNHSQDTN